MIKRVLMLLSLSLMSLPAWAATYTFSSGGFLNPHSPPPCSGNWTQSGSTFSCSGRITLAQGDVLRVSTSILEFNLENIRVIAQGGFALSSNAVIGTAAKNISLESNWGTIDASGGTTLRGSITTASGAVTMTGSNNMIYGSVSGSSGNVSITGGTISGSVSTDGSVNLVNGSVAGNVYGRNGVTTNTVNVTGNLTSSGVVDLRGGTIGGLVESAGSITTNGTLVNGTLTSTNGAINLTGGRVTGLVRSNCCMITSNGTNLLAGAWAGSNGLNITGGTIQGPFFANGNVAQFSGVNMVFGSLSGASTATFSNSTLGSAELPVTVTTLYGPVNLNNTTAFGDFTAPDYATIFVNSPSTVNGTCLPHSTPREACRPPVVPRCLSDNFSGSSLNASDWAVTSRSGSFGVPRIVNGRLRLTDNSGNVATGATIQRLVPAANNLVQVEFKYYGYNGSGADGVAVIFSDASLTPQPGGYGGSLGYAQLNGTSGFSGGWLGIALDEFGNFSNPTETRNGGPGARADSVAIRGSGSGTTGYRYLRGTSANLNPGVDVSGSSAGPGHTYRITLDSRTSGRTMVSVERNTGSGFVTLIAPFDAQAEAGQAALPTNFFVTFTGSTGGSNNIHELDDLSFCADRLEEVGQQIDHFRFDYSGNAVTCSPQPITIRACRTSDCSSLITDPVSVTLAPGSGWSAAAPATLSGSNVINFSGGTATAYLRSTTLGTVALGVTASTPRTRSLSEPVCSTANCRITYNESGFVFDVPTLISARPQSNISVRAVRSSNNAQVCVPGFANVTRSLQFTSAYRNPGTGTQPVVVNDAEVRALPVSVPLTFNASGEASLTVRYDDAGEMRLNASYSGSAATGDSGLNMAGTDDFVVKPYGLCIETDATCSIANASCAVFPNGVRAGDSFPLRIRAVRWQSDSEPLTAAALCDNLPTPNFQLANIPLSSTVAAPAAGDNGVVGPNTYNHALGATTTTQASVSEVGVFTITATPGNYLGVAMSGGTSGLVGRFVPAYLRASGSATLRASCGNAFSYQGQAINFASTAEHPSLTVTAYNRGGGVTTNYDRPSFWKLSPPQREEIPYRSVSSSEEEKLYSEAELDARHSRLRVIGTPVLSVIGENDGDGSRTYRWTEEQLLYVPPGQPGRADAPFEATIEQRFPAGQLREVDGPYEVCHGNGAMCEDFRYTFAKEGNSNWVRLGRIRSENIVAVGNQGNVPVTLEHWSSVWARAIDGCTQLGVPAAGDSLGSELTFQGDITGGTVNAAAWNRSQLPLTVTSSAMPAQGSVLLRHLPRTTENVSATWLCQRRGDSEPAPIGGVCTYTTGTGVAEVRALASFGVYGGSPPLIYRRELYRQP